MGQCFSATVTHSSFSLQDEEVITIPDLENFDPNTNKKYIFSDGCGYITQQYAQNIGAKLIEKDENSIPLDQISAFQIRYKGFLY